MGGFQIPGGGLDVRQIVDQLMYIEAVPIRRLEDRGSLFQQKIDAYEALQTRLSELAGKIGALNSPDNFAARLAKSSNEDILTADASSTAAEGTYNITVNRLALVDNFVTDATFTESDEVIGTGSFDLTVGSETTNITIDGTNNTLEGLKNAINNSGANARAAIVNDGSGFRLTVTSQGSGSENAISVANNTLQLGDSSPLTFSRTHIIADTSELDAELIVNGLTITSSGNSVANVIEGVTLDLTGTSASTVSLTISNDTDQVREGIQDFVDAYNDAVGFINSQFTVVSASGRGGTLAGDGLLRRVQSDLGAIVRTSIEGTGTSLSTLGSAGISLQSDGTLEIESSKLDDALDENFNDFSKLFLATATTTNSNVLFESVGSSTEAGSYEVEITQAAESATLSSPNSISGLLGVDETLTITFGSTTSVVNLLSTQDLDSIIDSLNAQFDTDDVGLVASKDAGQNLIITSEAVGSATSFTVVSDVDGSGTGFGTTGLSDSGLDVQGTFRDLETGSLLAATGSGNFLIGAEGGAKNLSVRILGSTIGILGDVNVTLGYAERFERALEGYTDEFNGPVQEIVGRLEGQIRGLEDEITDIELRLELRREQLTAEFTRADNALRQLAQLQGQLSGQGTF